MMLKDSEMYKLKEKIKYDFDTGKWKVPPFLVKSKEVAFPKLGLQSMNLVKEQKNDRDIVLQNGEIVSGSEQSSRMNESGAGMTGQFGGEGIRDNFH